MTQRMQSIMIMNGALVFLVGLLSGFPYAYVIIEKIVLWPIPGEIDWTPPGDERAWRMAHLEGILNGLTLIAVAAAGSRLKITPRAEAFIGWGLIITSWGNITASVIGPIFGGRGLYFGDGFANSLVYLLFVLAVITVITAMIMVFRGALADLRDQNNKDNS
ncbi:MAG: hypothetical protein VCC01_11230 [Candidatus Hydrogenedentota bacterium]